MAITFEEYYEKTFGQYVNYLTGKLSREEAEDRVQNVFLSLLPRKEFCEELIEKGELEKYIQGAINRQPAQVLREQYRRVSTVSLDADNIDFLSSIRDTQHGGEVTDEVELDNFYKTAVKCLASGRKLSGGSFETVGELWQYIFIQYCRNGRTFQEAGKLVGLSHQNISAHFARIVTILTPMIEAFIGRKIEGPGNKSGNDLQEVDPER
jgi:hypothetical protein